MSQRNIAWLIAIVVVGVVVGITVGIGWGLGAAAVVLVLSELVERAGRRRRRAARGDAAAPSIGDAIDSRRKRR